MKVFRLSLLSLAIISSRNVAPTVADSCPLGTAPTEIDLSGYAHGDYIEANQDLGNGVTVSVTGAGDRRARIYDTGITGGLDPDLEVDVGNCLIMQQDEGGAPNDNSDGGNMRFRFPGQTLVDEIAILDAESGGTIFYKTGNSNAGTTAIPPIQDKELVVIQTDKAGVDFVRINLKESGAICKLQYCVPFCPAGMALVKMDFSFDVNGPLAHGDWVNDFGLFTVQTTGGNGPDARIYDSADSTNGADEDLEVDQGNVLIIQQKGEDSVTNDNMFGGRINFSFPFPVKIKSLGLVDFEVFTQIQTFDTGGTKKQAKVPFMGDKTFMEYEIPDALNQPGGINALRLRTKGSGGISHVELCVPEP